MKKKFDAITIISIILLVLTWLGVFISMNSSNSCIPVSLNSVEKLFGGAVYAAPSIQPQKMTFMSLLGMMFGIVQVLAYAWCVFLIAYSTIKFTNFKIKSKDFEKNDEFELKNKESKRILKRNIIFTILIFIPAYFMAISQSLAAKPVIYIYPEVETTVQVSVGYPEKLSCVYPKYEAEEGWEVIAKPNGDLVDTKTGRNLYCLYWEGNQKQSYKFKDGFVVAGEDSAKFLEEKLAILGLNEREANEFIIYWLPKLEANKYNLIRFETVEEIEEYMPLNIEPKPDTVIRIVMDFKGLNRPIEIEEQKLETPVRAGYTVVEWGGSEF